MKSHSRRFLKIITIVVVLFISTAAITVNHFEISKNLDIFAMVYKKLNENYVGDIDPGILMKSAIDGMLKSLDPYTVFYSQESINDARIISSGEYAGIGASVAQRDSLLIITDLYDDSPAKKAGLAIGDAIITVSGVSMINKTTDDARELLNGAEESEITMIINRWGANENKEIVFKRKKIKIDVVSFYGFLKDSEVAYIKLESFTQEAASKVLAAYQDLESQKQMSGLVLDLRGNGGGLLIEAVKIVNMFIDKDLPVVITKGRIKEKTIVYKTKSNPINLEIPLVVLINGRSASASEIVAGALQDYDRAVIMGQKSFGKGLVQNVVPLSYKTSMKITTAKYYIPSGRCIQSIDYLEENQDKKEVAAVFKTNNGREVYDAGGIIPDVIVADDKKSVEIISMLPQYAIFDFASEYAQTIDSISPSTQFELKDGIVKDFIDAASEHIAKDDNPLNYSLIKLKDNLEAADISVSKEISTLEEKIKTEKKAKLDAYNEQIRLKLESEILRRFYNRSSEVKMKLKNDLNIDTAIELLKSKQEYESLLAK